MDRVLPGGAFYGDARHSRQVGDFLLTEAHYPPRTRLPRHCHRHAYLCLVRRGGYQEAYGRTTRACGPLTLAWHPPGEMHSQDLGDQPCVSFNIDVNPAWARRMEPVALAWLTPVHFRCGPAVTLALRLYREFLAMDTVSPAAVEELLLEVLSARQPASRSASRPRWLHPVEQALRERCARPWSLTALARLAGVHPVHLATAFKRAHGCTIGDYVRRLRVESAVRALASTLHPLAAIALDAGFADQSHFTRLFKAACGLTPSRFRALLAWPAP